LAGVAVTAGVAVVVTVTVVVTVGEGVAVATAPPVQVRSSVDMPEGTDVGCCVAVALSQVMVRASSMSV
jgi:hypothetical protein